MSGKPVRKGVVFSEAQKGHTMVVPLKNIQFLTSDGEIWAVSVKGARALIQISEDTFKILMNLLGEHRIA